MIWYAAFPPGRGRRGSRTLTDGREMDGSDNARYEDVRRHVGGAACVDVVIAARDRSDTIERAVKSALMQPDVRTVIVIDDGSADDTAAIASRCDLNDERLIVRSLPLNRGPSAARNTALEFSTAPWICVLDGDDYLLPGRIAKLLAGATGRDFVADDLLQVHEQRIAWEAPVPVLFGSSFEPRPLDLEEFVRGNIRPHFVHRRELGFLKPLIRRAFIEQHRLRYDESLRLGEDYALYARALALGARFLIVPAAGYVSVVRSDSLSARHSRLDLERLRDSDTVLLAWPHLSAAERRALRKHREAVDCRVQWLVVIEAVKSQDYLRLVGTFLHSVNISIYLARRLLEEIGRRTGPGWLKPARRANGS
jgi:succinoglycan biosynthesis protein ExoU